MTQEKYRQMAELPYVGKHEKKWYVVTRFWAPGSPVDEVKVFGKEEVKLAIKSCWQWNVRELS